MASKKYLFPAFLKDRSTEEKYLRWLSNRSRAHILRDTKRGLKKPSNEVYKMAIHKAVVESNGFDFYTGEKLDWSLIGKYNNEQSKLGKRKYKSIFNNLPSVDHVNDVNGHIEFKICSWRVNDAKSDMTLKEFVELCKLVVKNNT